MRFPRPGSLLSFAAGLLLCFAGSRAFAQMFAQPTVIPTGSWPAAIYTADYNGDGIPDLIYIDPTASHPLLHTLLGDGHGGFTPDDLHGWTGSSAAVADFTASGTPQIANAYNAGVTAPALGPQCATFAIGLTLDLQIGAYSSRYSNAFCASGTKSPVIGNLFAAKLRDGGPPELLFTDSANNLLYAVDLSLFASPQPAFTFTSASLPDGGGPIFAADLNGDGHLDLVVNGQTGFAADIFLGDGSGKLNSTANRFGASNIHSMLLQDMNNDGRPDLIAEGANGSISAYFGDGTGSFTAGNQNLSGNLNGIAGNGGHLIAGTLLPGNASPTVFASTPAGVTAVGNFTMATTTQPVIYNPGPGHTSYAAADFNGDGNLDIAVDSPEGIAILYGRADGSFQTNRAFVTGYPALDGALAPFISSANLDAIVSIDTGSLQFLQGMGDGTFTYSSVANGGPLPSDGIISGPGMWGNLAAGDFSSSSKFGVIFTADGKPAALYNQSDTGLQLSAGLINSSGDFSPSYFLPPALTNTCPNATFPYFGISVVADFNLDGFADIANRQSNGLSVLLGGAGLVPATMSRVATTIQDSNCNPHAHDLVVAGDLNGDGYPDLVEQSDGSWRVFLNDKTGHFPQQPLGDLSVDGSLTTSGQLTAPAINSTFDGPAIPTSSGGLGFPAFPGSAVIADLDRDGNNDFIATYANLSANLQAPTTSAPNYIYIWFGSGGGKFLTSAKHPVNPVRLTPSRNFYQVAVADMNGDGVPDLILSDGYVISVQLGKGDGTFGAETHYLGGQGINSISVADVNHDGKLDLVLANGGAVLTNPVANLEVPATNPDVNTGGITVLLNQAIPAALISTGTVTASPEPTTYGEAFSVTATVTSPLSGTAPTGTVAFSIDGNAIGSEQLLGTTATISPPQSVYSTLTVGQHTLTAVYSGDGNYAQETITGSHTVSLIPTTIGLALCVDPPGSNFPCGVNFPSVVPPLISPVTMYFGQSIDGIATESENDLTGSIVFYNGTAVFCTLNANLQQGGMTCPVASGFFPVGNTEVTVDYTGDSTHAASMSNAVQVIVSPDITTAAVASSVNPSSLGQSVTFTANVQGNYAAATGSVTFLDGTSVLGAAMLDATGHATFATANLALGHHPITVAYAANTNFNAAVSPVLAQVVTSPVQGIVTASPNPAIVGNAITLSSLIVPPPASSATVPTGSVVFSVDGAVVGQATLTNGTTSAPGPATLSVGTHTLSAVYSGDANYLGATFAGTLTVILSPTTTTLLPTGTTTLYYGQPANSTYNVYGMSTTHPPSGNITVQDNGVSVPYCTAIALGSACPYADGGANKLTVGTHSLVVLYLGDSYNAPSVSPPVVFTVLPDTTTATLTSSDNPAIVGASVTFTAKVAGNFATPSGTASFMDGATTLGTATLDGNGNATFATSGLALGTHPITVVYNSNPNFNPATSAVLNQQINDGPTTFTLTVTPTPITVEIGRDAVLQVTVTATGGFAEPVQLSCPSVPEEATCTFNQALIPAGGGVTTLYFSAKAPGPCGSEAPYAAGLGGYTVSGIALACLAMLPLYRRRRVRVILVSLISLCGLAAISGCGHCTDLGTRPGNYTFTVMGTAQGSVALTASQTITVTVTTTP